MSHCVTRESGLINICLFLVMAERSKLFGGEQSAGSEISAKFREHLKIESQCKFKDRNACSFPS